MLQNIIDISNVVAPFVVCTFILYICCGWILVFFKRDTLVSKYFTNDIDMRLSSVLYVLMAVAMLVVQMCTKLKPDELTPLGFMFLMCLCGVGGIGGVVYIIKGLIKYRNSLTPQ
ncbi:hypothetical protein XbC2_565 [Xanthomonas phage XbC2]|nr:hypothetical protein XbC2_565 [Xanthomonas phage XbC2]